MRLSEAGEDRLLAQILPTLSRNRSVVLGAGDDCAVLQGSQRDNLQLFKTDCVVEGIHFETTSSPVSVGWKAMARPLSDFAAMSGVPQFALVTLIVPGSRSLDWAKKIYRGLEKAARAFGVAIVGGETSNIKGPVAISVSLTGFVEKDRWVGRSGGKAKDDLFVTGRLGGSLRGRHLRFVPRIEESRWLTQNFSIRLAGASGVGFEVDENAIPQQRGCSLTQAISDGEDYELLFAISPKHSASLKKRWHRKFPTLLLTRVGRLSSSFVSRHSSLPPGYVHFK
jgi:thiamine-monophosphate kinase